TTWVVKRYADVDAVQIPRDPTKWQKIRTLTLLPGVAESTGEVTPHGAFIDFLRSVREGVLVVGEAHHNNSAEGSKDNPILIDAD
ncbi:hypothetical protein JG688_00007246, partial [Phytophthora aleatoria]